MRRIMSLSILCATLIEFAIEGVECRGTSAARWRGLAGARTKCLRFCKTDRREHRHAIEVYKVLSQE